MYSIYNMGGPGERKKQARCIDKPEEGKPKLPEPKTDTIRKHKKVLFVDDEQDNLKLYKRIVARYKGSMVLESAFVSSVDDAIELLKSEKFDLVISDYNMPEKNGIELVRLVKENSPDIRIIITSARIDEATEEAEKLGLSVEMFEKLSFYVPPAVYAKLESLLE